MAANGTNSNVKNNLSKMDLKIVKTITQEQWLDVIHTIVDQLDWNNSESDFETWRKGYSKQDFDVYVALEKAMAMWEKYATRSGFNQMPTWRMLFISVKTSDLDLSSSEDDSRTDHTNPDFQIKPWREVDLDSIFKLDLQVTNGMDRKMYMKATLGQPSTWTMVATECQTGDVIGIFRAREVIGGHLDIGPFYATSPKVAECLLRRTIMSVPDWQLRSRVDFKPPSNNGDAVKLINQIAKEKKKESFLVPQFTHEIVQHVVLIFSYYTIIHSTVSIRSSLAIDEFLNTAWNAKQLVIHVFVVVALLKKKELFFWPFLILQAVEIATFIIIIIPIWKFLLSWDSSNCQVILRDENILFNIDNFCNRTFNKMSGMALFFSLFVCSFFDYYYIAKLYVRFYKCSLGVYEPMQSEATEGQPEVENKV